MVEINNFKYLCNSMVLSVPIFIAKNKYVTKCVIFRNYHIIEVISFLTKESTIVCKNINELKIKSSSHNTSMLWI